MFLLLYDFVNSSKTGSYSITRNIISFSFNINDQIIYEGELIKVIQDILYIYKVQKSTITIFRVLNFIQSILQL